MMTLTPDDIRQARAIALDGIDRTKTIIQAVAEASGIPAKTITSQRRNIATSRARHLVMFIANREGIADTAIAIALGVDRSTVAKGVAAEAERRAQG